MKSVVRNPILFSEITKYAKNHDVFLLFPPDEVGLMLVFSSEITPILATLVVTPLTFHT